jgi:cytochrome c-type biogenesis protein CcmH/NrfG
MRTQARQLLQEALRADPGSSKALCLLGCVEGGLRNHAAARAHFAAGADVDPQNAVLLGAWARMEAAAGDLPRAEQLFGAALALNPANIVLLQARACFGRDAPAAPDLPFIHCMQMALACGLHMHAISAACGELI